MLRPLLYFVLLVALPACDAIPRDAAGALDRIRASGEVRVGVDRAVARGVEAEILERWAATLGARVVWVPGPLPELVRAVHERDLDVVAAGLTDDTPFAARLAISQPYQRGSPARVLAVTQGESALLYSLDRFVLERAR